MERVADGSIAIRLDEALENGRIQAYFQPVYRSYTGNILSVEALGRWMDPHRGLLSPAEFIPDLEQSGQIFRLDMEILRQSCLLYREMENRGTPISAVSVNLSRHDFQHEALFETVTGILAQYQVPHHAIKLEVTESLMMEDSDAFRTSFRRFSDAGFSVWLDDFGSGYSSLNMLQNYSFDVIKFDMLFLKNLSFRGMQLLASLIAMAKTLGIHTLCEGIETAEQREFLLAAGCEAQQGFYYSMPLSVPELTALVDTHPGILETQSDKHYWDQIGRLNFLSPNPLREFSQAMTNEKLPSQPLSSFDNSIALLECGQSEFNYVYATEGYRKRISELGFDSIQGLESALSNHRSHQYLMLRKLILDAVTKGTVQTVEYVNHDVYYRFSAQLLSRKPGRVMMAVRLNTFDSEQEVKTSQEMLNYSSALFSTYDLAVLIYPDKNVVTRIHSATDMPVYDQEKSIQRSLERFCEEQVESVDQSRYMQFLDFATMARRVNANPRQFIQSYFRMHLNGSSGKWHTARVNHLPSSAENAYILLIQSLPEGGNNILDAIAASHPEMLEDALALHV